MCRKSKIFLLALVLGPFVLLQSAAAQEDHSEAPPLSVTTQLSTSPGTDCKSGESLVAQMRYTGTQPLRGYLVRLTLAGSVGSKKPQELDIQDIRDSHEAMIASGAEWTRTICLMPETAAGNSRMVTAKVDVLKFADNSIWGPAALPASHQLIGALDGMDFTVKTTELERFVSPIQPQQGPLPVQNVQSQTIGPLRIESGVWLDEHGKQLLAVEVTNESANPIRGYVFTATFLDPTTGNRIRRVTTKQLETHGNPSDYLAPGAAWVAGPRKFSYLPDGSLASYTITLDLVVFADGSTFGPKKSQESEEVLGMFRGIDSAKLSSREISTTKVQ
jgi:hypothetical protein